MILIDPAGLIYASRNGPDEQYSIKQSLERLEIGFPLMYQKDVLEILEILTRLGYRGERRQEALDLVISKQDAQAGWKLVNTFNGRFQVDIEEKGKPSKWITLNTLRVLQRFFN